MATVISVIPASEAMYCREYSLSSLIYQTTNAQKCMYITFFNTRLKSEKALWLITPDDKTFFFPQGNFPTQTGRYLYSSTGKVPLYSSHTLIMVLSIVMI